MTVESTTPSTIKVLSYGLGTILIAFPAMVLLYGWIV